MLSKEVARRCISVRRHLQQQQQQRKPVWSSEGSADAAILLPPPLSRSTARLLEKHGGGSLRDVLQRLRESVKVSSGGNGGAGKGVLGWYLGMVEARPVVTKSVTASVIFSAADVSSQLVANKLSDSFDLERVLRMAGYGMLILGPMLHLWFNFISRILPKRDVITTLKKILIGQTLFGPVMTAIFFSTNAMLQGESRAEITARLERDLFPTIINGLLYWPMADFITFKFIPVRLQPVVCNAFSFFWTIYLTKMASSKKVDPDKIPVRQSSHWQPVQSLPMP